MRFLVLVVFIAKFVITDCLAVISYDAGIDASAVGGSSSLTYSHTVGVGSDTALVVGGSVSSSCDSAPNITSVTYAGDSMTNEVYVDDPDPSGCANAGDSGIYTKTNPATGANNVVVTLAGTNGEIHSSANSFFGVNQTDPTSAGNTNFGFDTAANVTVTTQSGDVLVDHVCNGNSVGTVGAAQTERTKQNNNTEATCNNSASSTQDGVDGGAMTWTVGNDLWLISSVSLTPAEAGAPAAITPQRRAFWIRR